MVSTRLLTGLLSLAVILTSCGPLSGMKASSKRFDVASYGKGKAAIAKLVADVNKSGGGQVVFPKGATYRLGIADDLNGGHKLHPQASSVLFAFRGCASLEVDLNGSTIILEPNHSTKYSLFYFFDCKSFTLKNGKIVGDASDHDYSPVIYSGKTEKSSHEWGHGVMVMGSRGTIEDLQVTNMCGDGIYVASCKNNGQAIDANVEINRCDVSYCRRNGITSASTTGFSVIDTYVHNIGTYGDLKGTDPCAGIDFEYEDKNWFKGDVIISGCTFSDCEKKTISAANSFVPKVRSFIIENSTFSGSRFQIANLVSDQGKIVRKCRIDASQLNCGKSTLDNCEIVLGRKIHYVHGTTFTNCTFVGTLTDLPKPYGCALVGYSLAPAHFVSCSFKDIRGLNDNSPAYQGISGYNFPLKANFKDCTFQNVSFVKGNSSHESSFTFEGCSLSDGCMIYNEGGETVVFKDSKIDNVGSYPNQKGKFSFDNCVIIQDDETVANPLLYFGDHSTRNTNVRNTLSITQRMKSKGVTAIKLKELNR